MKGSKVRKGMLCLLGYLFCLWIIPWDYERINDKSDRGGCKNDREW